MLTAAIAMARSVYSMAEVFNNRSINWHTYKLKETFSEVYEECSCTFIFRIIVVNFSINLVLLLITVFLAFKSRNLPSNFNETGFIFTCVCASLILLFCFQPLYLNVDSGIMQMRILNMSILINHTICLCALFLPKVYAVKLSGEEEKYSISRRAKRMNRWGYKFGGRGGSTYSTSQNMNNPKAPSTRSIRKFKRLTPFISLYQRSADQCGSEGPGSDRSLHRQASAESIASQLPFTPMSALTHRTADHFSIEQGEFTGNEGIIRLLPPGPDSATDVDPMEQLGVVDVKDFIHILDINPHFKKYTKEYWSVEVNQTVETLVDIPTQVREEALNASLTQHEAVLEVGESLDTSNK
jgi:hypothetical protein